MPSKFGSRAGGRALNTTNGLILSIGVGSVLGALYLYSLWLSVRRLGQARRPLLWLLTTGSLRIAAVTGAIYVVMDGRSVRLLACLAGFLLARLVLLRFVRINPTIGIFGSRQ